MRLERPLFGGVRERPFATTPDEWFARLAAAGVERLSVRYGSLGDARIGDRMSVAFVGGGGHWRIGAQRGAEAGLWEARWQVGNRDDPERRIWNVTYGEVGRADGRQPEAADLAGLVRELADVFGEIGAFAREQGLDGFAGAFDRAVDCLRSDEPRSFGYHADLAPAGVLPLDAERILGAAQAGWVFGGMGSWNDLGFDGAAQARYESLSDRLYSLLNRAAVEAANASAA
ncbi:MAG TPA: hypothetical protein VF746_14345 [Longimicrobium sp.]